MIQREKELSPHTDLSQGFTIDPTEPAEDANDII